MGFVSARRPGWLLEAARERRPRGMVAYPPQGGGQNPAFLVIVNCELICDLVSLVQRLLS